MDNTHGVKVKTVVLLVDDQAMVAEGIRRLLAPHTDIEFHACDNPVLAIKLATELQATVILQDLVMPDVDGMTLVRFYRNNPATKDIPVIVLSSKEDPKIKSEAFEMGASDYLVKMPNKIELVARIRAHAKSYIAQRERDEAFHELNQMKKELEEANLQLASSNQALHRLSTIDALTNIANRRCFDTTLEQEWNRCAREKKPISLVLIDIDFFKPYNDHYGHQGGDNTLVQVARTLADCVRRPGDLVARYGGEEFVMVLPDTNASGAASLGDLTRLAVRAENIEHEKSKVDSCVTISLGIATIHPPGNLTPALFIKKADEQLYLSKEGGRNRFTQIDLDLAEA